jgi:acetyl-CoA acetyltransferase
VATAAEAVADVPDGASPAMGGFGLPGVPNVLIQGVIALGHPLGAPGARLAGTVAHQLARRGSGVATSRIGVGQGIDLVLER